MQTDEVTGRHVTLNNRLCLGHSAEAGNSAGSQRHRQQSHQPPGAMLRRVWSPRAVIWKGG